MNESRSLPSKLVNNLLEEIEENPTEENKLNTEPKVAENENVNELTISFDSKCIYILSNWEISYINIGSDRRNQITPKRVSQSESEIPVQEIQTDRLFIPNSVDIISNNTKPIITVNSKSNKVQSKSCICWCRNRKKTMKASNRKKWMLFLHRLALAHRTINAIKECSHHNIESNTISYLINTNSFIEKRLEENRQALFYIKEKSIKETVANHQHCCVSYILIYIYIYIDVFTRKQNDILLVDYLSDIIGLDSDLPTISIGVFRCYFATNSDNGDYC